MTSNCHLSSQKVLDLIFMLQSNILISLRLKRLRILAFLWTTYLNMDNFYPCFSGEEGQVQSPSRPTPPPYRSTFGFQGDAPHGNIFR